ncbi:MAG: peptide-methionine (S)-S-oxide reductase MsrA [Hyphomicrobiales bacterium]|nr:peptide-methionine (S)-S-oxide reductase MsrA [Hyphomicrobiales bacterium]
MGSRLLRAVVAFALTVMGSAVLAQGTAPEAGRKTAIFAGGCFWCMEHPFDEIAGVVSVTSGYTGGTKSKPTYEEVSSGTTGHAESVQVVYDPGKVSYQKLVDVFWHNIDPLAVNAQFCDHGTQYRSAIFYQDDEQKRIAEASKEALVKSGRFDKPIVTQIVAATTFWPAEDYHQRYYRTHPVQYKFYRYNCGRDQRLEQLWGKPNS